jgi:glycosyltransferase involved in cell wall biosynthesis
MKILFATYPMAFHTPGGGEMQLLAYRKHLEENGHQVTLLDPWNPRFLEHDIVHFFACVGGSVHFCNFIKRLGLPLVMTSSLWITPETKHLYPIDEIRMQLSLADRIITNSNMESDALSQVLSLPRSQFSAVYNGIDDFFVQPVSADLFRSSYKINGPFVLNVGNIEPRKNQLSLVRAMKSFPDYHLVLIGHQRDPEYASQVLTEGGNQVMYLGPMHQNTLLLSAYRACNVFCLPSTLETPGLAALEASAQDATLLITSEGSCTEYFNDRAHYVNPQSVEDIRQGLATVLYPNTDTHVRSSYNAKDFLWRKTILKLQDIYNEVVEKRTSAA